jgi:hypothetical protein
METRDCGRCGAPFKVVPTRGRPRIYCDDCRAPQLVVACKGCGGPIWRPAGKTGRLPERCEACRPKREVT